MTIKPLLLLFSVMFSLLFTACMQNTPDTQTNTPPPKKFTAADVAKLRWIEGTWRGSGVDQAPFFERYRFENATTLAVDSFPDEKLEKVDDTSRFEWKDGQFGSENYAASSIDDTSIDFVPINANNSFRWERVSDNSWKATLRWRAQGDKAARERIYNMERIPSK